MSTKKIKRYSLPAGEIVQIEQLAKGEIISLIRGGKPTKKTYQIDGYCRFNRAYQITALDDFCADRYLKKGTKIVIAD